MMIASSFAPRGGVGLRNLALCTLVLAVGPGCASQVVGPTESEVRVRALEQASARRDLGIDHLSFGRTAMAIRELQYASELNPDDAKTWLWLGEGYRRKGRLDDAEGYMLQALELAPDYQSARLNLSGLYIQMERWEDAIAQAQVLIDDPVYPAPWTAYSNKGWAELQAGRLDQARESLEQALDFRRNYWPASLSLGILANKEGHRIEAIEHFERVIDREVGFSPEAEANFRIAEVYVSLGRRDKAVEHFEAAVVNAPDGSWAEESKRYLKLLR
jgi:Tfp pilus assembly protein PilF